MPILHLFRQKLLKNGTLKTYAGFPHGKADTINADLLTFIEG